MSKAKKRKQAQARTEAELAAAAEELERLTQVRAARDEAAAHLLDVAAKTVQSRSLSMMSVERASAIVLTEANFRFVLAEAAAAEAEDAYLARSAPEPGALVAALGSRKKALDS